MEFFCSDLKFFSISRQNLLLSIELRNIIKASVTVTVTVTVCLCPAREFRFYSDNKAKTALGQNNFPLVYKDIKNVDFLVRKKFQLDKCVLKTNIKVWTYDG